MIVEAIQTRRQRILVAIRDAVHIRDVKSAVFKDGCIFLGVIDITIAFKEADARIGAIE